jgi:hypothetical protein
MHESFIGKKRVNATKMMRFENLIEEKDGEAGLLGASK